MSPLPEIDDEIDDDLEGLIPMDEDVQPEEQPQQEQQVIPEEPLDQDMDDDPIEEDDDLEGLIAMDSPEVLKEDEEIGWWDTAKDVGIQGALGVASAYTWPADVLKMLIIGDQLSGINELEEEFGKQDIDFDKNAYIKSVYENAEFLPTQELLEKQFEKQTGIDLEPKTWLGKKANQFFFVRQLMRGKGLGKSTAAGVTAAGTTAGLEEAGVPETISRIGGDVVGGGVASISKSPRELSAEAQNIVKTAEKHNLPLFEGLLEDGVPKHTRITQGRKAAFEKELGMTTEEALNAVIEENIPLSKLRKDGKNLEVLEEEAYNKASKLAEENNTIIETAPIIYDIESEISRIKGKTHNISDADKAAIRVLERQKKSLQKPKKGGPELLDQFGEPIEEASQSVESNAVKLIEQTKANNENVTNIYAKPIKTKIDDAVKNSYGFINQSIRNQIGKQAGEEITEAVNAANNIHSQIKQISKVEGTLLKAFEDGKYNPKKLRKIMDSKQGIALRRELGKEGVKQVRDIAEYGTRAQNAVNQLAKTSKFQDVVKDWGPAAVYIFSKSPKLATTAATLKPMVDYFRGWAMMNEPAREVYRNIIVNAAKGSYKAVTADMIQMQELIEKDFGSIDEFNKQAIMSSSFFDDETTD